LSNELVKVQGNADSLIRDLEQSIAEADSFIKEMESAAAKAG
jgi:hypothetical protein